MKQSVISIQKAKEEKRRFTMITAYDYSIAKLVDAAGIETILVGDSLGNTMMGLGDTVSVTMEDMIHHTACVTRGVKEAMVVADLPFMSYQTGVRDALINAGRLMKEGRADAVKLEGGEPMEETIRAIVTAGIPVCAHIGLTPQSFHTLGGYRVQGKDIAGGIQLVKDALAVERAGAFAVVLECVPAPLAAYITSLLHIPTIGIGAGVDCDAQVLVLQDMLGLNTDFVPRFVKQFANLKETITDAFSSYREEVDAGSFPAAPHSFAMDAAVMEAIRLETEANVQAAERD
ncbi:MAG: 3-methyl-2-oxobutanoate hydroxymethyltransferase [Lachnospiraceae bacterium]|nr:3-methyl-2-oxobutanoate hydroxymethyltransferase [Lachnospiraceae bacterium]MDY5742673.1 3-methyl-2-oxobutanoate hydroxymethyltransferase [Lachnospiraceae bacterium]